LVGDQKIKGETLKRGRAREPNEKEGGFDARGKRGVWVMLVEKETTPSRGGGKTALTKEGDRRLKWSASKKKKS